MSEGEVGLLREACRTADALDQLQAVLERDGVLNESSQGSRVHPELPELRQQRITFARLIAALKSNEPEDDAEGLPAGRAPRGVWGSGVRRRRPPDDTVPSRLHNPAAWPSRPMWMEARQQWMDAGNQWPGGEAAEFAEVLEVIVAAPDEPFDWDQI
ncbi:hypothetical protein [Nocardia asiatica]|uniref:hypothetical protein n=1 Tax=Nocardia asiatica TaxID=209252 RepID=UPI002454DACB|nr:hypothetical protein [Nocardia asiatica]